MSRVGIRLICALISIGALSALTLVALGSDQSWGGRVLFTVSPTHGVHIGDIPIVLVWLAGTVAAAASVPDSWRREEQPTADVVEERSEPAQR